MFNDGILLCSGERGTAPGCRINKITGGLEAPSLMISSRCFIFRSDPELTGGKWPQEMAWFSSSQYRVSLWQILNCWTSALHNLPTLVTLSVPHMLCHIQTWYCNLFKLISISQSLGYIYIFKHFLAFCIFQLNSIWIENIWWLTFSLVYLFIMLNNWRLNREESRSGLQVVLGNALKFIMSSIFVREWREWRECDTLILFLQGYRAHYQHLCSPPSSASNPVRKVKISSKKPIRN